MSEASVGPDTVAAAAERDNQSPVVEHTPDVPEPSPEHVERLFVDGFLFESCAFSMVRDTGENDRNEHHASRCNCTTLTFYLSFVTHPFSSHPKATASGTPHQIL